MTLSIVKACHDEQLFKPFLQDRRGKIDTWRRWMVALRCLYGLPVTLDWQRQLVRECTGRDASLLPRDGFSSALFLTGRRSGKSRTSAIAGAYEAALSGREKLLAAGEKGLVAIIAPTRKQGGVVKGYLRAIFDQTDMLRQEVVRETREGFELRNGVEVVVLVADWRSVRGYSLLACICDELAFMGLDEEAKVRSDTELVRAILPSLATTGGKFIGISSPYARKGYCWTTFKRYHGNDSGKVLVWNCASRVMNPTLPQSIVDQAMTEDLAAAKSEYLGEFRDDVSLWLPIEVIQQCVVEGRKELLPRKGISYFAFADLSGGRSDSAALSIAHTADGKVILDCLRQWKAPFNPTLAIQDMSDLLQSYGLRHCVGDRYAGEFVRQGFAKCGISYKAAERSKSELYLDLLSRLCSQQVELLDDPTLIKQLASLERRTRSGGKDVVDHQPGCHDDCANCAAGVASMASKPVFKIGFTTIDRSPLMRRRGMPGRSSSVPTLGEALLGLATKDVPPVSQPPQSQPEMTPAKRYLKPTKNY